MSESNYLWSWEWFWKIIMILCVLTDMFYSLSKCSTSNEIQWVCLTIWQGSEIKAGLHYAMA